MSAPDLDWATRYQVTCAGGGAGLVHEYATHNIGLDTSLGWIYGRDDWAAALVVEQAGLTSTGVSRSEAWFGGISPDRAVVIELDWKVTHDGASALFGPATGRDAVLSSTLVGLVEAGRINRAWRFVDYAAAAAALGVSVEERARALTMGAPARGGIPWDYGEVRAGLGQMAPTPFAAPRGIPPECSGPCAALHDAWNHRELDRLTSIYADQATLVSGAQAIRSGSTTHPWAVILSACPDAVLFFERMVAEVLGPREARVALVWRWIGTHSGEGLGMPLGHRLHARGVSTIRVRDGRIACERVVFDALGFARDALLRTRG